MPRYYAMHGTIIESDIYLPLQELPGRPKFDISITQPKHTPIFNTLKHQGVGCQWQVGVWHMNIPSVADFVCHNGSHITVYANAHTDNDDLTCFIVGPVLNALFIQRSQLLLQGRTIAYDDQHAFALLCNDPNETAGISYESQNVSWTPLNDEVLLPIITSDSKVAVNAGPPWIKLWKKNCHQYDLNTSNLCRVRSHTNCFYVPVKKPTSEHYTLTHIFELAPRRITPADSHIQQGLSAFRLLQRHVIGSPWLKGMHQQANNFRLLTQLANLVPITRLQYRKGQSIKHILKELQADLSRQQECTLV